MNKLEDCKECGMVFDDLSDVVYPTNRTRSRWIAYCNPTLGGCDREVYGETEQGVIGIWNWQNDTE